MRNVRAAPDASGLHVDTARGTPMPHVATPQRMSHVQACKQWKGQAWALFRQQITHQRGFSPPSSSSAPQSPPACSPCRHTPA
eukprot:3650243-Rhodomonas_salina.15